jgi:uncharacterized protein
MKFEWDEAKRLSNIRKHGVDFSEAKAVFFDPNAVELLDEREDYGEERTITIGLAAPGLLMVVSTQRSDGYRLISARRANKSESRVYAENAG